MSYYIGIDVGTGSVRSAIFAAADGAVVASSTTPSLTFRSAKDHRIFEQSTENIWNAICTCIRSCLSESKVPPESVRGLGFDATCSLAVTDFDGNPICVTEGELGNKGDRNIILWADHRAEEEATVINSSGSEVLKFVGGVMSLEMEIPKVLWIKNHFPSSATTHFTDLQFFDLPDYLTYRATGGDRTRSACSLGCKCSYLPDSATASGGWFPSFFTSIGLSSIVDNGFRQLGGINANGSGRDGAVLTAGLPVGHGLSKKAADELGLREGIAVGSGLIDAYAGWVGTVAARYSLEAKVSPPPTLEDSRHRLAAVAGTSTCYIVQSPNGVFVPGVWGPYKDAVFREWWMNEGGQSSTGQLIDHILETHPSYSELVDLSKQQNKGVHLLLENLLTDLCKEEGVESVTELTKDLFLYPDFHGNRSPVADPRMTGLISGLTLDSSIKDLAKKYAVTLEAIALQTKHIIDEMNGAGRGDGHQIKAIFLSGGQARNAHLMQLLANVCQMDVVLPGDVEGSVVRGAGMLGRFAHEVQDGSQETHANLLWKIMVEMTPAGTLLTPSASLKEKKLLEVKYRMFRETIDLQKKWRSWVDEAVIT